MLDTFLVLSPQSFSWTSNFASTLKILICYVVLIARIANMLLHWLFLLVRFSVRIQYASNWRIAWLMHYIFVWVAIILVRFFPSLFLIVHKTSWRVFSFSRTIYSSMIIVNLEDIHHVKVWVKVDLHVIRYWEVHFCFESFICKKWRLWSPLFVKSEDCGVCCPLD